MCLFVCVYVRACMPIGFHLREFFHLLSMELVNPDYALFEFVGNGLYKPNKNSSVNPAHLEYFKLTGTMMAKAICEGPPVKYYHKSIHTYVVFYHFRSQHCCQIHSISLQICSLT